MTNELHRSEPSIDCLLAVAQHQVIGGRNCGVGAGSACKVRDRRARRREAPADAAPSMPPTAAISRTGPTAAGKAKASSGARATGSTAPPSAPHPVTFSIESDSTDWPRPARRAAVIAKAAPLSAPKRPHRSVAWMSKSISSISLGSSERTNTRATPLSAKPPMAQATPHVRAMPKTPRMRRIILHLPPLKWLWYLKQIRQSRYSANATQIPVNATSIACCRPERSAGPAFILQETGPSRCSR